MVSLIGCVSTVLKSGKSHDRDCFTGSERTTTPRSRDSGRGPAKASKIPIEERVTRVPLFCPTQILLYLLFFLFDRVHRRRHCITSRKPATLALLASPGHGFPGFPYLSLKDGAHELSHAESDEAIFSLPSLSPSHRCPRYS